MFTAWILLMLNSLFFTLRLSGSEKPDLVFDCQGQGWFDADCDIIVTKEP